MDVVISSKRAPAVSTFNLYDAAPAATLKREYNTNGTHTAPWSGAACDMKGESIPPNREKATKKPIAVERTFVE